MDYRLALDIGTASCGLIVLALDNNHEPIAIAHHSLSIFSEPVLPHAVGEAGEPKKAKRRRARLARRVDDGDWPGFRVRGFLDKQYGSHYSFPSLISQIPLARFSSAAPHNSYSFSRA